MTKIVGICERCLNPVDVGDRMPDPQTEAYWCHWCKAYTVRKFRTAKDQTMFDVDGGWSGKINTSKMVTANKEASK